MSTRTRGPRYRPGWRVVVPFLLLAYPATFLLYRGGPYCGPFCFTPTLAGAGRVVGAIGVSLVLASLITLAFAVNGRNGGWAGSRGLIAPDGSASVALVGLFAAFTGFLTLDALSLYEPLWKPIVLPASFLLFLPAWALYVATFPLGALFSTAGVESSLFLTLALRGIVVFVGLALSAVWQSLLVSGVANALGR
jgi:hypothetical protein